MHLPTKIAAAALAVLLAGGSEGPALLAGLWEVTNTPGVARLNGRELKDLPLFQIRTEQVCVTPEVAANPAAFLAGDVAGHCDLNDVTVSNGRLQVSGVCPSADGGEPGTLAMQGPLERERYEIHFETSSSNDNGRMSFTGKLSGRRLGECSEDTDAVG
jgi:hypothetical protein